MDLQQEVKFLCSLFQQVQTWVSLPSVQWGFIAHVGTLCTVLICSAAFVPWIANKKKASQCYRKKELQTPPSPPLEFLWNDTTKNCVKFVPIDMQMLQSFTASGRRWMHYHVCFAHKYVYYHSAPASSKMIAIDVQIGQATQDKKKKKYAHEIFSSFSLFLIFLFLSYAQSSGRAGSLRLCAWAADLVFSQGDSCLLCIKGCDCPHLVRTELGNLPFPGSFWMRASLPNVTTEPAKQRVAPYTEAWLLKEAL